MHCASESAFILYLAVDLMTGQSEKSHQNIGDEIVTQECRSDDPNDSDDLSLRSLRTDMQAFRRDRNWDQYHVPRNLLLAVR